MKRPEGKEQVLNSEQQNQVLNAALSVIGQGGFTATIVEKIAERCAITAPRIFLHFGGTEKLIEAILERQLELISGSAAVPELRFPGETVQDELKGLGRIILEVFRKHLGIMRAMLAEALRSPEFAEVFYRTFILRGRKLCVDFLEERRKRGELRADLDVDMAAAEYLTSLIMSLLLIEVFGGKAVEQIDDERLVGGMTDLFLRGALPANAAIQR